MISIRAKNIQPSPTLAINAKVKEMRNHGIDVVDFGIGEPDFDTPGNIKNAAISAIKDGFTKYTPASGIDELKEAVRRKMKKNGLDYAKNQIVVSCGAKHSLYNAMLALLDKRDEVIIPVPYWVSYAEQVRLADGNPVFANTDKDFHMIPKEIEKKITKKTKIILINSPCNPSGAVCSKGVLQEIANIALENNLYIISDEIYESFVYNSRHTSIASLGNNIKDKAIVINGVSKTYAMTGWRIGYAACPPEIASAMSNIQSQTTSNPPSISQMAALEALNGNQDSVSVMVQEFDKRRRFIHNRLNEIGLDCKLPEGAFYIFPDISAFSDSARFTEMLLDKAKVAVMPGADFGMDKHIRISYATSMQQLEEGMDRMERFVGKT